MYGLQHVVYDLLQTKKFVLDPMINIDLIHNIVPFISVLSNTNNKGEEEDKLMTNLEEKYIKPTIMYS